MKKNESEFLSFRLEELTTQIERTIFDLTKNQRIFLLQNFKLITILTYIVNLVNIITELLKNNLIEKIQRKQINQFISKIIFYLSFIILFK